MSQGSGSAPVDDLPAGELRIAAVVARFNQHITDRLLEGARSIWTTQGGQSGQLEVFRVPGAFELPLAAQSLAASGRFHAIICLGCVIRGATSHYDYVCQSAAQGILRVGLDHQLPVIFGVLTTDTEEQALERAGGDAGNKGEDAVLAAIEMARLLRQVADSSQD